MDVDLGEVLTNELDDAATAGVVTFTQPFFSFTQSSVVYDMGKSSGGMSDSFSNTKHFTEDDDAGPEISMS